MPDGVEMFPAYLREAGYYTTNNSKEDYNYIKDEGVWDESSKKAHWRNREPGQPFFHKESHPVSHESRLHFNADLMETYTPVTDPASKSFCFPNILIPNSSGLLRPITGIKYWEWIPLWAESSKT